MKSQNNHTLTTMYESKGKLLKTERGPGRNSGRNTNGWLIKKKETGTTNYSIFKKTIHNTKSHGQLEKYQRSP